MEKKVLTQVEFEDLIWWDSNQIPMHEFELALQMQVSPFDLVKILDLGDFNNLGDWEFIKEWESLFGVGMDNGHTMASTLLTKFNITWNYENEFTADPSELGYEKYIAKEISISGCPVKIVGGISDRQFLDSCDEVNFIWKVDHRDTVMKGLYEALGNRKFPLPYGEK